MSCHIHFGMKPSKCSVRGTVSWLGPATSHVPADHTWLWPSDWTAQLSWRRHLCKTPALWIMRVVAKDEAKWTTSTVPLLGGPTGFQNLEGPCWLTRGRLRQTHRPPYDPRPWIFLPVHQPGCFPFSFQALGAHFSSIVFFYSWLLNAPSSPFPGVFFIGICQARMGMLRF